MGECFNASQKHFPPSYSPVGWFSPLNSINFHFPNLISWIFSISLSPLALRIIPEDDISQCCSRAIGEIITTSFCRQNMAFTRRNGIIFYKVAVEFELFSKINPMLKKCFNIKQKQVQIISYFTKSANVCLLYFIVSYN